MTRHDDKEVSVEDYSLPYRLLVQRLDRDYWRGWETLDLGVRRQATAICPTEEWLLRYSDIAVDEAGTYRMRVIDDHGMVVSQSPEFAVGEQIPGERWQVTEPVDFYATDEDRSHP